MTKKALVASLILATTFFACKKDDSVEVAKALSRELALTFSTEATTIQQIEPITITASGARAANDPSSIIWSVNGKEVGRGASYLFRPGLPGSYNLTVSTADGEVSIVRDYIVQPRFTSGAFLLNEGNRTNETGVLTYVDAEKKVILDSAYIHVNGTKLGNVCQDLAFANDKVYIISQNGPENGGEGLLTIAETSTLRKIKVLNDDALAAKTPTHIAVVGEQIYLCAKDGVYRGTENGGFTLIPGTSGAVKQRMVVIGQRVFVQTSTNKLLMIQGNEVVKELLLAGTPNGLALADDGNLWVAYTGSNSNTIAKVSPDPADFKIIATNDVTESLGSFTSATAIHPYKNELFFVIGGWGIPTIDIYKHDFASKTTVNFAKILDAKYFPDMKIYYNSIGVDPKTGYLYYAGMSDYQTYKQNITAVLDTKGNILVQKDNVNSFPACWHFIPTK